MLKTQILAAIVLSLAIPCAAATIRTAAELAAANRGELTDATDFALTATLSRPGSRNTTDSIFVFDATGATSLRLPFGIRGVPLHPGDTLQLEGVIDPFDDGGPSIVATNFLNLGNGPAPQAQHTSIGEIHSGRVDFRFVRLTARVHDAFVDDISRDTAFLVLVQDGQSLYAAVPTSFFLPGEISSLVGSLIDISGLCDAYLTISRRYRGRTINPSDRSDITIVRPAATDVFSEPDIANLRHTSPDKLLTLGRHTARGRVIVGWGSSILIRTDKGEIVGIEAATPRLPRVGDTIMASGFPATDLYTITLTRATWKKATAGEGGSLTDPPARTQPTRARDLIQIVSGHRTFVPTFHGRAVRMEGVVRTLPDVGNENRLQLDCDDITFAVDTSACPSAADALAIGCRAAFTGICVMNVERLRPNTVFPHIRGFTIVMRPTDSVTVLARHSWWTPGRIWAVFGGLVVLLLGALAWNASLRHIAERRGRELLRGQIESVKSRLQVEERTRLAVELHDSLSQTLTGVSMEIAAADDLKRGESSEMATHLARAGRTLKSCRDELRNCLWDLRSEALDEPDMTRAVYRTLEPHIDGPHLSVRFNVPRTRVTDNTAHALLRMIRELVVNALRHGHATSVKIAGSLDKTGLRFSVRDDGCGFDPDNRPGILQGHFGLQGIEERLGRLGGTLTVESSPGHGTRITGWIPAHTPTAEETNG